VANITHLLATEGQRVGVIDTDTNSPVLHYLFGLKEKDITYSFNDYLEGKCDIEQAAYDLTTHLKLNLKGQIFLIPANTMNRETTRQLNNTGDVDSLNTGCQRLIEKLNLDALLIDTQSGLNEKTLVSISVSDTLAIILRHDQRDYQGTSVTIDVVRKLNIPRVVLIVNEIPTSFDFGEVKTKVEQTYNCEVLAVLPHVDEVMALANKDIFALRHPNHPFTAILKEMTATLVV
jgi:MinD-like ATPase involved in chromosome partitioning or flagellar assembly